MVDRISSTRLARLVRHWLADRRGRLLLFVRGAEAVLPNPYRWGWGEAFPVGIVVLYGLLFGRRDGGTR